MKTAHYYVLVGCCLGLVLGAQPLPPEPPLPAATPPAGTNGEPLTANPPREPQFPAVPPAGVQPPTNSPLATPIRYVPREQQAPRQIRPVPGGARADFGRLKVQFANDASEPGPVTIITPDNRALSCRASFLALYDAATGQSVLLGQVTNSAGCILPPASVIYSNAFDGIRAHIRYDYNAANHSLSQDILLEENPALPDSFQPAHTRLEVWTAWAGAEPLASHSRTLLLRPATHAAGAVLAHDETADFGAAKLVPGSAFSLDAPEARVPVARSWVHTDGTRYLVETVDYLALKPSLHSLDPYTKPRSALHLAPTRRELLQSLASAPTPKNPRPMLVAQLPRASVVECASPLALSSPHPQSQTATGPAHSKTLPTGGLPQNASAPSSQPAAVVLDFIILASVPVPPDAVSWWPAEGDPNDLLNTNNGTLINGVSYDDGQVAQAFSFDGSSGYVEVPSNPTLSPTGPFTVEAWINYHAFTGGCGDVIVAKGRDAEAPVDWFMGVHTTSKFRPAVNVPGGWLYFDCSTTLLTNTWYHVAMVYDGASLIGYVNGADDGSYPVSGDVQATAYPLRIGAYAPLNGFCSKAFFSGRIDELTLYNRALAPAEIHLIYNAGPAGKANPNCVNPSTGATGWWTGDGNPGDFAHTSVAALHNGVSYDAGAVGQAFRFNGTNAYAEVPSTPGLAPTGPFAVEGWINYDTLTGPCGDVIIAKGPDVEDVGDWALSISAACTLRPHLAIVGGVWNYFDCTNSLQTGAWYHVAMVYDGAKLIGYLNGARDGEIAVSGEVHATAYPLRIGAYAPINGTCCKGFFAGRIDELTVYDHALSDVEIGAIYSAGSIGKCKLDSDQDGLSDLQENFLGNNPNNPDTDGDGLSDWDEIFIYLTNPNNQDSDGDGVIDQPFQVLITRPNSGSALP